jgi:hypothetical protein
MKTLNEFLNEGKGKSVKFNGTTADELSKALSTIGVEIKKTIRGKYLEDEDYITYLPKKEYKNLYVVVNKDDSNGYYKKGEELPLNMNGYAGINHWPDKSGKSSYVEAGDIFVKLEDIAEIGIK